MIQFAQNRGPVALHVSRSLHKAFLFVIAVANHFVNKPSSIADEVCCTASTSVKTEKLRGDNPHFTRISKHRIYMREVTPGGKFDPVNFKTIPLVKKIPRKFTLQLVDRYRHIQKIHTQLAWLAGELQWMEYFFSVGTAEDTGEYTIRVTQFMHLVARIADRS